MDVNTALDRLELYARPYDDPELNPAELQMLLDMHARCPDPDGVEPDETGWVPSYSVQGVYRAAAEAWKVKLGAVAGRFDFTTDGQTFRRSQQSDHCEAMIRKYL